MSRAEIDIQERKKKDNKPYLLSFMLVPLMLMTTFSFVFLFALQTDK